MYHPPPSIGFVENSMEGVRMYKVDLYVRVRRACMVEGMSSLGTLVRVVQSCRDSTGSEVSPLPMR